jgi:hypothetical protein
MGEGVLVGGQQCGELLVAVALGPGPARVAERHHEHVHLGWPRDKAHPHLAPVDLRLLPRLGLEAPLGERSGCRLGAQWTNGVSRETLIKWVREPS